MDVLSALATQIPYVISPLRKDNRRKCSIASASAGEGIFTKRPLAEAGRIRAVVQREGRKAKKACAQVGVLRPCIKQGCQFV